ncbi:hypothetical protein A2U01_0080159, partial [Trifolium medium]|nr:hypothetical protein [Trifolium medium]
GWPARRAELLCLGYFGFWFLRCAQGSAARCAGLLVRVDFG